MYKNISKSKIVLAIFSLLITCLVWQQGLKDSLSRPSVSFDISQKEYEISELALPAIPKEWRKVFVFGNPKEEIREALSKSSFNEMTERNKLIWLILQNRETNINEEKFIGFQSIEYRSVSEELRKYYLNEGFKPSNEILINIKDDRYLYHLLNDKFNIETNNVPLKNISRLMFIKILIIRLIPLLSIFIGSILVIKTLWDFIKFRNFEWPDFKPLELQWIDMVLLISGGFVVIGEVFSPLISLALVDLVSKNFSSEIVQSLKIFFGYLFMAIPPLLIIFYQIKSIDNEFLFNKDYLQFNFKPLKETLYQGFKGWIMVIPFVLLISLIMNLLVDNQGGSNPLLEIVLNNNNYVAFFLLFITTTILAPLFEEIVFRGVLLPILSRDFGIIAGILSSSFVFAIAHLSIGELPPLFILGIGLGITRLASGRLLSSIIMHSLWNGLTFLNLFLLRT